MPRDIQKENTMSFIHHKVPAAGIILLALFAGLFFISAHERSVDPVHDHGQNAIHPATTTRAAQNGAGSVSHDPASVVTEHDDEALADMHEYAERHLNAYADVPGSFGGTSTWSAAWHLHWIDVAYHSDTIRLYHLSAKDESGRRFVAMTNSHDPKPIDWNPVTSK
jgi:hypothetical protein